LSLGTDFDALRVGWTKEGLRMARRISGAMVCLGQRGQQPLQSTKRRS
jgi:hypothetical protein